MATAGLPESNARRMMNGQLQVDISTGTGGGDGVNNGGIGILNPSTVCTHNSKEQSRTIHMQALSK